MKKTERQRLLELAGLDAKHILREAKEIQLQLQFDDDSDRSAFMKQLKRYGLKGKPGGNTPGKAQDEFVNVQIPSNQSKLIKFLDQEMGLDKEEIEDMYPELDTGSM